MRHEKKQKKEERRMYFSAFGGRETGKKYYTAKEKQEKCEKAAAAFDEKAEKQGKSKEKEPVFSKTDSFLIKEQEKRLKIKTLSKLNIIIYLKYKFETIGKIEGNRPCYHLAP